MKTFYNMVLGMLMIAVLAVAASCIPKPDPNDYRADTKSEGVREIPADSNAANYECVMVVKNTK